MSIPTSMTSDPAPKKGKWELVLPDLKVLSRSLQLVCQSGDAVGCPLLWRLRPLFLFFMPQYPVSSTLYFRGEGLQACVAWGVPPADVLSAVARSRCKQRVVFAVFKALGGDCVYRCPFPLLPFQCIFIFFMSSCVKLSFFCNTNYFSWYDSDMWHLSGVFLKEKNLRELLAASCKDRWTKRGGELGLFQISKTK